MAKISEGKKIREYTPEQQEVNNGKMITYLLSLLGVSARANDGREAHYLAVDQFISDELGSFTYAEIKQAFIMLMKGEFAGMKELGDFKVFSKLDCVILSRAMNCYQEVKRSRLRTYVKDKPKLPEMSESAKNEIIKKGVIRCFKEFKEKGHINTSMFYVYDVLDNINAINVENEKKLEAIDQAKRILKSENKRENPFERAVVGEGRVIAKAKVILLEKYFRHITESELQKIIKIIR